MFVHSADHERDISWKYKQDFTDRRRLGLVITIIRTERGD